MKRIALLAIHVEESPEAVALGAASVGVALRAAGFDCHIVEGFVCESAAALADRLFALAPDAVGFSIYSWNRGLAAAVAHEIGARSANVLLFAGGPEATADPEGVLSEAPLAFVVRGEGEVLAPRALELLAGISPLAPRGARRADSVLKALAALPGIAIRGADTGASCRAPSEDLARLPSPWTGGLLDPAQHGGALWELARGCPFRCAYCYEGKGEPGVRRFPRERIEAELALFARVAREAREGVFQVFVLDPTFNADRARARAVLDLLSAQGHNIHWKFELRAEFIDRELARRFASLDCSLQIGLQTADPEVAARVGRRLDPEDFARRIGYLDEMGAIYGLDLMYGLPGDSYEGFARSLDFAIGLAPNHLDIFPLAVLPGTELRERAVEFGLEYDPRPPYLLRSSPGFPPVKLDRASRLALACDVFYSRGRAVSWFLRALKPLKMRPSTFLAGFADFLTTRKSGLPCAHAAIESLQLSFLEREYAGRGLERILPALKDVVRLNGAYARALAEGERSELELSYDPDEVFGPAALDLAAFVRGARRRPSRVAVVPGAHGPRIVRRDNRPR